MYNYFEMEGVHVTPTLVPQPTTYSYSSGERNYSLGVREVRERERDV